MRLRRRLVRLLDWDVLLLVVDAVFRAELLLDAVFVLRSLVEEEDDAGGGSECGWCACACALIFVSLDDDDDDMT